MAVCVQQSGDHLTVSSTSIGSCTDYVIQTVSDYSSSLSPLTIEDTVLLSSAVVVAWAFAWYFKILRRAL